MHAKTAEEERKEAYQSLNAEVKMEDRVIEYNADKTIQVSDLIQVSYQDGSADVSVSADPQVLSFAEMQDKEEEYPVNVTLSVPYKKETLEKTIPLTIRLEDTAAPVITLKEEEVSVYAGDDYDPLSHVQSVRDPVDGDLPYQAEGGRGTYTINTDLDLNKPGDYTVEILAADKHGNETSSSFTVAVKEKPAVQQKTDGSYTIKVNRAANTVTIYDQDGSPVKAMVCSTGTATPLGTYHTLVKYRWRLLYGGVYGQYATRIVDSILFHSVPYKAEDVNTLEGEEFNKLGTAASLGCVRLQVKDAKWIYDHCPIGTTVTFYDDASDPGPLGKPAAPQIDPASGCDPTDAAC